MGINRGLPDLILPAADGWNCCQIWYSDDVMGNVFDGGSGVNVNYVDTFNFTSTRFYCCKGFVEYLISDYHESFTPPKAWVDAANDWVAEQILLENM